MSIVILVNIPVWTIRKIVREERIPAYSPNNKSYLFDPEEVSSAIKKKSWSRERIHKVSVLFPI